MNLPASLHLAVDNHPYPLLFATVSGAHLYGFPSPDSDYDLRGAHILPVRQVIGLEKSAQTIEVSKKQDGIDLDLVTHDIQKFFLLLLKKNGYVLEQVYSPLIVRTCAEHDELKVIARDCITRHHSHHYLGFADSQWRLFQTKRPPRVKPLLYVYRVLLTGIYLMRTGIVEANLLTLNQEFGLPYVCELLDRKVKGVEHQVLDDVDTDLHRKEYERLRCELEESFGASNLPDSPSAQPALNDLLKRLRMRTV